MAQIVIDVNGTPTLFSPALAHALRRGDVYTLPLPVGVTPYSTDAARTRRVLSNPSPTESGNVVFTRSCPATGVKVVTYDANRPVLRAVGANSGCGGAR